MKKFQFAVLALAALAIVACNKEKKNDPDPKPVETAACYTVTVDDAEEYFWGTETELKAQYGQDAQFVKNDITAQADCVADEPEFVSLISVTDGSVDDWNKVTSDKLVVCNAAATGFEGHNALKSVKVYADQMYINIYVTWDEAKITDLSWVPFHIYLDADNSDATGGYGDEFADPNSEWMFEDAIIADGPHNYDPAVFKWWGGVGENGWLWTDPDNPGTEENGWGAIIPTGQGAIGTSQLIGTNGTEIQLLREAATCITFAETFGIGFDIQQNWNSAGILPNADPDAATGSEVLANKLKVTIDK